MIVKTKTFLAVQAFKVEHRTRLLRFELEKIYIDKMGAFYIHKN